MRNRLLLFHRSWPKPPLHPHMEVHPMKSLGSSGTFFIRMLAVLLLGIGLFALIGSLFMWGEGFILPIRKGVDYRFPITDLLVNTPASIIAAIGLLKIKRYGYIASQCVAGFYLYASCEIFVQVIQAGPPYALEIVLPQVIATFLSFILVFYFWRVQSIFK
jgi:hypothetical protein